MNADASQRRDERSCDKSDQAANSMIERSAAIALLTPERRFLLQGCSQSVAQSSNRDDILEPFDRFEHPLLLIVREDTLNGFRKFCGGLVPTFEITGGLDHFVKFFAALENYRNGLAVWNVSHSADQINHQWFSQSVVSEVIGSKAMINKRMRQTKWQAETAFETTLWNRSYQGVGLYIRFDHIHIRRGY